MQKKNQRGAVGLFLIVWFNDCVLGKSVQIANPIIVKVDPVPYYPYIMLANLSIVNVG